MKGDHIEYRAGYKYVLQATYRCQIDIYPCEDVVTDYVLMGKTGMMTILAGYPWDGATGFPDMPQVMRASLIHDALYALLRAGLLGPELREPIDNTMRSIALEDEMPHILAQIVYEGARIEGAPYADPANEKPVISAP